MKFDPFKYSISELNRLEAKKGRLLVAEPFMKDDYFKRSVVLLCESNEDGSVGFILNQELDLELNQVIHEGLNFTAPLFLGGPVEPQNLFFIHTCEGLPESIFIEDNLYWGGDFELLKEYLNIGKISLTEVRFFLGYSGWDAEQLVNEIDNESWLIGEANSTFLFNTAPQDLWKQSLVRMGKSQALLSRFPEDPSLN